MGGALARAGYANGLVNAIAAVVIGWAVDRYELRRTWVIGAGCLLLGGMMVLEVRVSFGLVPGVHAHACCAVTLWSCIVHAWLAALSCLHRGMQGLLPDTGALHVHTYDHTHFWHSFVCPTHAWQSSAAREPADGLCLVAACQYAALAWHIRHRT